MQPQAIPAANAAPPPTAAERVARDAFHALVDRAGDRMYRLALRMTGSADDARDVLQEGFLKAFQSFAQGGFEGQSAMETWLYRIVVHVALDFLKTARRARRRERDWGGSRDGVGPSPEVRVALVEMQTWLAELPELQRVALVLRELEGLQVKEVAEALGCTEGAVEQLLVRARKTLRERRSDE